MTTMAVGASERRSPRPKRRRSWPVAYSSAAAPSTGPQLLDGRQDATPGRRPVDIALLEQLVGLLTKAFFWPMGAGSVALLVWAGLRGGGARYGKAAAAVAAIAIAIGGWWYVRNLAVSGSFFGALDLKAAGDAGGTWQLIRSRWSLAELGAFARGLAVIAASFTWAGT
jgi:hypothetical protein